MIHAVIGVCQMKPYALYVKRSQQMKNYPGVWSLLSMQFVPEELPDHLNLDKVDELFDSMSRERLGGVLVQARGYLVSGTCEKNPMNERVVLHLYDVAIPKEPKLNPLYYEDIAWLQPEEYIERAKGQTCGLCMRLWSDYCVKNNLARAGFAPALDDDVEQLAL